MLVRISSDHLSCGNLRARAAEAAGEPEADPLAGAGDERRAPGEIEQRHETVS